MDNDTINRMMAPLVYYREIIPGDPFYPPGPRIIQAALCEEDLACDKAVEAMSMAMKFSNAFTNLNPSNAASIDAVANLVNKIHAILRRARKVANVSFNRLPEDVLTQFDGEKH